MSIKLGVNSNYILDAKFQFCFELNLHHSHVWYGFNTVILNKLNNKFHLKLYMLFLLVFISFLQYYYIIFKYWFFVTLILFSFQFYCDNEEGIRRALENRGLLAPNPILYNLHSYPGYKEMENRTTTTQDPAIRGTCI